MDASRTILVVDDSTTMRRMVMAALRGVDDARFEEAPTGLAAIERLSLGPVDLMILDLNMPDMHGLEVLSFVRGQSRTRELPVIVLTTRGDDDSRAAAMAEGATAYFTKPFQPDTLQGAVRKLLQAETIA